MKSSTRYPTELEPVTRSVLFYLGFFLDYFRRHFLHNVGEKHISNRVSLLFRVALHRSPRFPFPHLQRNLSITLSLFQRDMLLTHVEQSISLFKSPHSCKNCTPVSWSENKNKKNNLFGKPSAPTTLRPRDPIGTTGKFFISSW